MNPALEKLTKYLRLEAQRDFDNQAVMGGLARMLEPWEEEARETGVEDRTIKAVVDRLRDYGRLSPDSRRDVLEGLWSRLQSETDELGGFPGASERARPQSEANGSEGTEGEAPAESVSRGRSRDRPTSAVATQEAIKDDDQAPAALEAPLTTIRGIGPKSAKTLEKLDLYTLGDLLWHFPRRYDDYSELKTINRLWYGEEVTIIATVDEVNVRTVRSGKMKLTEATVSDGTGSLRVTWFNQPWIARKLKAGQPVVLSAKMDQYLGKLTMNNPEWEPLEREQLHTNRIVPVYPLTAGVTSKWIRRVMHSVVGRLAPRVPDPLPPSVRESADLLPLPQALEQVHFPDGREALERARHRLAFDELFLLQLGVLRQKKAWESQETVPFEVEEAWIDHFIANLPFELTEGQQSALADVRQDLASQRPMNRLLEGDVGSGKTVIAAVCLGIAAHNGSQSALMAPTSILAEQHYTTLNELMPSTTGVPGKRIRLLLGDTPQAEKEEIHTGLAEGTIDVVIGTHALLEEPVRFQNLGLTIIDEQQRFGVDQRAALRSKGTTPNLLVMTATPIPRSLALTIYGDLDLSVIPELPPGRTPVKTRVLSPVNRSRAYNFILGQLQEGRQAFIIYPLVEGSEKVQAKAAVDEHENLQEQVFLGYRVGLLHGRLKGEEKEQVMHAFRDGEIDVLVSTSVVEVGVDVPNASVLLVEGANRFGLSQLHQFRGRVGRGEHKSYCLLIPNSDEEIDNERLKAMEATNNGFELAEMDLRQRGPGDFFGTRQSGFAEIRMARLTDVQLIEKARREAKRLFERDPDLDQSDHRRLRQAVDRAWCHGAGDLS